MNAQTEITHDLASALGAFWRKGRREFVPLTAPEAEAAGLVKQTRLDLASAGLIASVDHQNGGNYTIWSVTRAGEKAFFAAGPARNSQPVPAPKPDAKPARLSYDEIAKAEVAEWRKRGGFGPLGVSLKGCTKDKHHSARILVLSVLAGGPIEAMTLAVTAGYASYAAGYKPIRGMLEAGLITLDRRRVESGQRRAVAEITTAGREWLAQNGGAQ